MAISFFAVCNAQMIGQDMEKLALPPVSFPYIAFLIANGLACVLFVIGAVKSKYKPNMAFLCIFTILFCLNLITTFKSGSSVFLDSPIYGSKVYELLKEDLLNILQFFLVLLVFFIVIDFLPKTCDGKTLTNLLAILFATIVGVLVIISYCLEADKYIAIFKGISEPSISLFKSNSVQSIIVNPNPYSFLLFTAMVACSILHYRSGKWWFILLMVYFLVHIPFTFCRVSMIVGLVYFVVYFIIRFIITFKTHRNMNVITIIIVSGILFAGVIALTTLENATQWVSKFFKALNAGIESLSGRIELWNNALKLFSQFDIGHGYGFKKFDYILERYMFGGPTPTNGSTVHEGYLDFLCSGGIVFALIGLLFYIILFVRCIRIAKVDSRTSILGFVLITCGLAFSAFETGRICFANNLDYTVFSMFIWIPISSIYFNEVKLSKFEKAMIA